MSIQESTSTEEPMSAEEKADAADSGGEAVVWRDGAFIPYSQATTHVMSHMSARGSQVFDVIIVADNDDGPSALGLRQHVARFVRSAELMGMENPGSVGALETAVAATVMANVSGPEAPLAPGPMIVKMIAAWADEGVGITPATLTPTVFIVVTPYDSPTPFGRLAQPIKVKTAPMPKIPASVLPPSIKVAAAYTPGIRHHLAAEKEGFDHVLFRTQSGDLAESVTSSVLVVSGGRILAPPVDTVLDGITRRVVLDAAQYIDVPNDIRPVSWDEVLAADELLLTSTVKAVVPFGRLDDQRFDAPGPVSTKLAEVLSAIETGRHELSGRWMTPLAPLV
jgi:branched-chain amino acid aminotransferase